MNWIAAIDYRNWLLTEIDNFLYTNLLKPSQAVVIMFPDQRSAIFFAALFVPVKLTTPNNV